MAENIVDFVRERIERERESLKKGFAAIVGLFAGSDVDPNHPEIQSMVERSLNTPPPEPGFYLHTYNEQGENLDIVYDSTLEKIFSDIKANMSNNDIAGMDIVRVDAQTKKRHHIMTLDKEGLHHVDLINHISHLGDFEFIGGTLELED